MKAAINALAMALVLNPPARGDGALPEALSFATRFFEENAELFEQRRANVTERGNPVIRGGSATLPTTADREYVIPDDDSAIRPSQVIQPRQPGELMPHQVAAIGNVGLCPNCQQPNTDHLPGCARISVNGLGAMDPKARTKNPLPAAEA